jgi:hypothetical protein
LTEITPEDIFKIHSKIRWVGLASERGEVIFAKQRNGLKSLSPEDAEYSFMQMGPLLVTSICERMSPWTGSVVSIVVNYDKLTSLIMRVKEGYLALTVDKEQTPQNILEIAKSIKKWAS